MSEQNHAGMPNRVLVAKPLNDPCWQYSEKDVLERRDKSGEQYVEYIRSEIADEQKRRLVDELSETKKQLTDAELAWQSMDWWIERYRTWPADIRQKLSIHDLRRMTGWRPPYEIDRQQNREQMLVDLLQRVVDESAHLAGWSPLLERDIVTALKKARGES